MPIDNEQPKKKHKKQFVKGVLTVKDVPIAVKNAYKAVLTMENVTIQEDIVAYMRRRAKGEKK